MWTSLIGSSDKSSDVNIRKVTFPGLLLFAYKEKNDFLNVTV